VLESLVKFTYWPSGTEYEPSIHQFQEYWEFFRTHLWTNWESQTVIHNLTVRYSVGCRNQASVESNPETSWHPLETICRDILQVWNLKNWINFNPNIPTWRAHRASYPFSSTECWIPAYTKRRKRLRFIKPSAKFVNLMCQAGKLNSPEHSRSKGDYILS
jgi:hypothetical protein